MSKQAWGENRSSAPRRGRWSQVEIARFKELYGLRDEHSIARELNRSVSSIRRMAESVFQHQRSGPWQSDEVLGLRRYLGASSLQVISRILGRPVEEIRERLEEMRRVKITGRWSQEEVNELKRLYGTREDEDLAVIFGRTPESIHRMAKALCIAKDKAFLRRKSGGSSSVKMPRWRAEELKLLEELYSGHSNLDIAQQLGRSVKSVVSKAHNLGLRKAPQRLQEMGRQNVSLRYSRKD